MAQAHEVGVDNVIGNFIENLNLVITQMKDGESKRKEGDKFNHKEYWDNMGSVFKLMSHEATKLSMAFSSSPPPTAEVCQSLIESVEKTTLTLVSLYYTLPKSQGIRLRRCTKAAVIDVLEGIKGLAESIKDSGLPGSGEQLQSTGAVWQGADIFPNLPQDNKGAVLHDVRQTAGLVRDALQEIEEAVENGGPDDDWAEVFGEEPLASNNENTWTESDKTILGPCLGLIKTSKSLLKKAVHCVKSNGRCDKEAEINQLDDLADYVDKLSPCVDEFILSLYPPMRYSTLQENAQSLFSLHSAILNFLRESHFTSEDDQKWVEFLLKANQHNFDNIQKCSDETVT